LPSVSLRVCSGHLFAYELLTLSVLALVRSRGFSCRLRALLSVDRPPRASKAGLQSKVRSFLRLQLSPGAFVEPASTIPKLVARLRIAAALRCRLLLRLESELDKPADGIGTGAAPVADIDSFATFTSGQRKPRPRGWFRTRQVLGGPSTLMRERRGRDTSTGCH
jgi:hypothetical protein